MIDLPRLNKRDWLLLTGAVAGFGFLVSSLPYGTSLASVATETSVQEMTTTGSWLVPTLDGIPWLDSPPLAHWLIAIAGGIANGIGIDDTAIPSLLAVLLTVVLTARQGAVLFGRRGGLLSGIVVTTMISVAARLTESTTTVWLAPAGAMLFVLFDRIEAVRRCRSATTFTTSDADFAFSRRAFDVTGLFLAVGTASLLAGSVAAVIAVLLPLVAFVGLQQTNHLSRRYLWGWGWLMLTAIAVAWPAVIWSRLPQVAHIWTQQLRDASLLETGFIQAAASIAWMAMPWTVLIPVGLWSLHHDAFGRRNSRELLIWCQTVTVPIAVLMFQPGHPEFCLMAVTAWSLSATAGVLTVTERVCRLRILNAGPKLSSGILHFVAAWAAIACVFLLPGERQTSNRSTSELRVVSIATSADPAARCLMTLPKSAESGTLVLELSPDDGKSLVWSKADAELTDTERIAVATQHDRF